MARRVLLMQRAVGSALVAQPLVHVRTVKATLVLADEDAFCYNNNNRSDHFSFSFTFNFAFNPRDFYTRGYKK